MEDSCLAEVGSLVGTVVWMVGVKGPLGDQVKYWKTYLTSEKFIEVMWYQVRKLKGQVNNWKTKRTTGRQSELLEGLSGAAEDHVNF